MSIRHLAWTSIALNVVLVGWGLNLMTKASTTSGSSVPRPSPVSEVPTPVAAALPATPPPLPPGPRLPRWDEIHNEDLTVFVRNLRELECPEAILQTVIVSALDEQLLARWNAWPGDTHFWQNASQAFKEVQRQRQRRQAQETERRNRIKELLGVEWYELTMHQWGDRSIGLETYFGPLPAGKLEAVASLFRKYDDLREDAVAYGNRMPTPTEAAQRQADYAQMRAELGAVLSPEEVEEIELRFMTSEVLDVWSLASQFGNEFTPAEFREFLRIRKGAGPFPRMFLDEDPPPPDPAIVEDQEARILALLGPERFGWYERAKPFSFRHFQRGLAELGVPIEMTWKVYDIREAAEAEAGFIRSNPELTAEQREAGLSAIRRETASALNSALGATAWEKYQGADWLKELQKP